MNSKYLFIVLLALFQIVASRPRDKILGLGTEAEPEIKVRQKRKLEIPLLKQLEDSGVGVNLRTVEDNAVETKIGVVEKAKAKTEGSGPAVPPPGDETDKTRVKKQSPSNVCIKVGNCGKTVCGPVVSARGSVVNDLRTIMQGAKPLMQVMGDLQHAVLPDLTDGALRHDGVKMDNFNPQARTVDTLMGIAPLSLGSFGGVSYSAPSAFTAAPATTALSTDGSSLGYGHSFFKPPSVQTVPAFFIAQQPSHLHPWLIPHLMPHLMPHVLPHLMPNIGSFVMPHRLEPQRFPEPVQTDIKQPVPVPSFPQPSYFTGDNTLVCTPYRNQRIDGPYDFIYKPDLAIDKSINVSDASKKSADEEQKMHEHLRKVNEIKDEITQLNRAAQRIVDQQERLTEMQQKQLWGSGSNSMQTSSQMSSPYMGSGYYSHPSVPWGYSKSNILSYPNSHDDIEFFLNLLRAGRKFGQMSDSFQQSGLSSVGDAVKGGQGSIGAQKVTTATMNDATKIDSDKVGSKKVSENIK